MLSWSQSPIVETAIRLSLVAHMVVFQLRYYAADGSLADCPRLAQLQIKAPLHKMLEELFHDLFGMLEKRFRWRTDDKGRTREPPGPVNAKAATPPPWTETFSAMVFLIAVLEEMQLAIYGRVACGEEGSPGHCDESQGKRLCETIDDEVLQAVMLDFHLHFKSWTRDEHILRPLAPSTRTFEDDSLSEAELELIQTVNTIIPAAGKCKQPQVMQDTDVFLVTCDRNDVRQPSRAAEAYDQGEKFAYYNHSRMLTRFLRSFQGSEWFGASPEAGE